MKKLFLKLKQVFGPLKKYKKKIILGLSVFLILFVSAFTYVNLTNPTKINKYIASVVNTGNPANNYFEDEVFYNAVIDAYNKENNTTLPYTTNLTEEQLATITSVSYHGFRKPVNEQISNTTGIEKLSSLKILDLSYNNLSNINIDNNVLLEKLSLSTNKLNNINLKNNISLKTIDLGSNNINTINLINNVNLISLYLTYNDIYDINLCNNINLKHLYIESNKIQTIDLSKNINLKYLFLSSNNISVIDLSKNINLVGIHLGSNNISEIDLRTNKDLTTLYLPNNKIEQLDLISNTELKNLNLNNNFINSINLNNNQKLENISLLNNKLNNIIFFDNYDSSNILENLGHQLSSQTLIDLGNNKIINPCNDYSFYINEKISLTDNVSIDDFVNNLGLQNLTARIYDNNSLIKDGNIQDGYILKIFDNEILIQNVLINVFSNSVFEDYIFYKAVVDSYNEKNDTSLPYTTNLTDEQLQTITSIIYSGKNNDHKIKNIKGIERLINLQQLILDYNNITEVDLSNNPKLLILDLQHNYINNIDLSNNINVKQLTLLSNNLSELNLKNNVLLEKIDIGYNNLSTLDLSNNSNITSVVLDHNKINDINLTNNQLLESLNLYDNELSIIDITHNSLLNSLHLSENNIKVIDIRYNPLLKYISIEDNKSLESLNLSANPLLDTIYLRNNNINSIDLSQNVELSRLYLSNNNLSNIDLSKNTKITTLDLSDNNLTSIDLSNNIKLNTLYLNNNPFKYNLTILKNHISKGNIIFPSNSDKYYISFEISDESIAKYENNEILALKNGTTNVSLTLHGLEQADELVINGTITVIDRLKGDVTGDDKVNLSDVSRLFKHVRGKQIITDEDTLSVCDVTGDGKITLADVSKLFKYARGKIPNL